MDNIYNKIEDELHSLPEEERKEILNKLRDEVDEIDIELVRLISKRTLHSVLIGRVKRSLGLPTYSPEREKDIAGKISANLEKPLTQEALTRIYERIIDESRAIQREEAVKGNVFDTGVSNVKVRLKNLLTKKEFYIVLTFFVIALCFLYYIFFTPNYYEMNAPVQFDVQRGETLSEISDRLYEREIIPNEANFKIAAFLYGAETKIRAARYYIPNGLSYLDLLDHFISGDADFLVDVYVPPGSTIKYLSSRLKWEARIDSAAFLIKAEDKNFLDSIGIDEPSAEGYLLPGEYHVYEYSPPSEVIGILYDGFQSFIDDTLKARADTLGYSIHEIVTLASIIEGETNKKSEMPVIAGVYYNRLKRGMKLQADPTVQYLQPNGWKRLLYKDLQVDSPYNTYKYFGLPPGPINSPGKDALLAAFYPQDHNYLYFVADGKGGHMFAKTHNQHLINVRIYREWLQAQEEK